MKDNSRILAIGDTHGPFQHLDFFRFMRECKKKFKPTRVIHMGDFGDQHALAQWMSETNAKSGHDELEALLDFSKEFSDLFPTAEILIGNHDMRYLKRAKEARIPTQCMRELRDVYGLPKSISFHDRIVIDGVVYTHGEPFCGATATQRLLVAERNSVVHGHTHGHAGVVYNANASGTIWGMNVGALIDEKAYAFNYGKLMPSKSVSGVGLIANGVPHFFPM